jgi:hypothetical protein
MLEVGDKIKIVYMEGEPHYSGREGTITSIKPDPWGDTAIRGTWGGLTVYPHKDSVEILEKGSTVGQN